MNNQSEIKELLAIATPAQYISFLFDLELSLMANNEFETYTEEGFEKHALYMKGMKNFFESLSEKR